MWWISRRRVALEEHVRQRLVELRDRVDVEVEADVRVLAVDHVDLGEAGQLALRARASATSSSGVIV